MADIRCDILLIISMLSQYFSSPADPCSAMSSNTCTMRKSPQRLWHSTIHQKYRWPNRRCWQKKPGKDGCAAKEGRPISYGLPLNQRSQDNAVANASAIGLLQGVHDGPACRSSTQNHIDQHSINSEHPARDTPARGLRRKPWAAANLLSVKSLLDGTLISCIPRQVLHSLHITANISQNIMIGQTLLLWRDKRKRSQPMSVATGVCSGRHLVKSICKQISRILQEMSSLGGWSTSLSSGSSRRMAILSR